MKTLIGLALAIGIAAPAAAQMRPGEYVRAAGASDLYEITSSRIVLQSTQDPQVRRFANMMIRHHTKSTADVKAAARREGLRPPPPRLMRDQSDMVAQLRAERGRDRDRTYLAQQRQSHQKALDLQQTYAREGTSRPLRMTAGKIVPVVESHIAMLRSM